MRRLRVPPPFGFFLGWRSFVFDGVFRDGAFLDDFFAGMFASVTGDTSGAKIAQPVEATVGTEFARRMQWHDGNPR